MDLRAKLNLFVDLFRGGSMGLGGKLNLVLAFVFIFGLGLFYFLSAPYLEERAREEVLVRARIMMESAAGTRKYTNEEIAPLLTSRMGADFHPQTVAAYAATKNFEVMRANFPDYSYREVALNPTNPRGRALEWEADIINDFRSFPKKHDSVTYRDTPQGRLVQLSQPIRVDKKCLVCHSRWEAAPKSLIAAYGKSNGFGWKANEIVGAQIVSVPMAVSLQRARETRLFFMKLLAAVFLVLAVLLNVLLRLVVLKPLARMSHVASEVSMGKPEVPEYVRPGTDEIASLSASFNRMRRTVEEAMKMLGESLKK
jgi:HAMP domain-containing protein